MHRLPSALPRVTGAAYGAVLGHIAWPTPVAARVRPAPRSPDAGRAARAHLLAAGEAVVAAILQADAATAVSLHIVRRGAVLADVQRGAAQRYSWDAATNLVAVLPEPQPVTCESLFDLASLTKVVATTAAIMALISDGRLALHARAAVFLPELVGTDKSHVTVDQLLRHRSGLPPWAPLYLRAQGLAGVVAVIAAAPLLAPPGGERIYSDLGYILLGAIVSAVVQAPLDAYLVARITGPLGLKALHFCPPSAARHACVATAHGNNYERRMIDDAQFGHAFADKGSVASADYAHWRTHTLRGEANDGNAHYALGGVAGHAGLFGTAADVAAIAAAMTCTGPTTSPAAVSPFAATSSFPKAAKPLPAGPTPPPGRAFKPCALSSVSWAAWSPRASPAGLLSVCPTPASPRCC